MSALLKEIKQIDASAAYKLEQVKFCSDSDLLSLTREDLSELFPGVNNLKRRKAIFDAIHKQKPIDLLLKDLKQFIPDESLKAALSNNGVLLDYLHILKDMKAQMNNVQSFLDAHISLLEDMRKPKPQQERDTEQFEVVKAGNMPSYPTYIPPTYPPTHIPPTYPPTHPLQSTSASSVQTETKKPRTEDPPQRAQSIGSAGTSRTSGTAALKAGPTSSPPQEKRTVTYRMVISGKTLGAHKQLLDKVQGRLSETMSLELGETDSDAQSDIIFVFCPIVSRPGTDVDEALKKVEGFEHVILVVMHHSYEPKFTSPNKYWASAADVVLNVNVFYHDTKSGLLKCHQNDDAIAQIRRELQKYGEVSYDKSLTENPSPVESEREPSYMHYSNHSGTHRRHDSEKSSYLSVLSNLMRR